MKIRLLLAALCLSLPTLAAAQSGGVHIRVTYYSDASLTTIVGESVLMCDGSSYSNGYPTEHGVYQEYEC